MENEFAFESNDSNSVQSESDEDYDIIQLDIITKKKQQKKPRTSISAEAFGIFNQKKEFEHKIIEKSNKVKSRISEKLKKSFMFSNLDEKSQNIVIEAVDEVKFMSGDKVITQGEDGDVLYIVDSGKLDCFKQFSPNEKEKYLKTYECGESFGELALLYNVPRAASIICKEESVCFTQDRETFNHIVKGAAIENRRSFLDFLNKVITNLF